MKEPTKMVSHEAEDRFKFDIEYKFLNSDDIEHKIALTMTGHAWRALFAALPQTDATWKLRLAIGEAVGAGAMHCSLNAGDFRSEICDELPKPN